MSVLQAGAGIILGFAIILIPRLIYWYCFERKPDVPKVTRDNITEICHRLRVPPPPKL